MAFLSNLFGNKENKSAENAARDAAKKQQELEAQRAAELAKQKQDEENNTTRDAAKDRQKKQAAGAIGGRDTILTGPLGDTSVAPTEKKSILGM